MGKSSKKSAKYPGPKRFRDLAGLVATTERLEAAGFAVLSPAEAAAVRELTVVVPVEDVEALGERQLDWHRGILALDRARRLPR